MTYFKMQQEVSATYFKVQEGSGRDIFSGFLRQLSEESEKKSRMSQGGKSVFLKGIEASTFARKLSILSFVPTCLTIYMRDVFSTNN